LRKLLLQVKSHVHHGNHEQEDDGEEDGEEVTAKLGDISNRMNLRSRSKRFRINKENENATASKNSLKRRHDEDENCPKKAKK
jgi:hypothetical protein